MTNDPYKAVIQTIALARVYVFLSVRQSGGNRRLSSTRLKPLRTLMLPAFYANGATRAFKLASPAKLVFEEGTPW
jgi:hypothetical protein